MTAMAIRRRKLYEDVADHLDKLIQAGAYAPYDLLPSERDLMKHFGVGRPAVREALFHLRKKCRLRSALGYLSPQQFEVQHTRQAVKLAA